MRDPATIEFAQAVTPEWLIPVFSVVTRFGDVPVLVAIACLYFWVEDRKRGGYAFALILGGLVLLAGLKATLAVPRPPADLHLIATDSPSFPSGHAMGATVVYGTLAVAVDRYSKHWIRLSLAGVFVALISVPRVVLGVHYPIDIAAGVVAGVIYVLGATALAQGDPFRAFAIAGAIALAGLVLGTMIGETPNAICVAGSCVDRDVLVGVAGAGGGLLGWTLVDDRHDVRSRRDDGQVSWRYALGVVTLTGFVLATAWVDGATGVRVALAAVGTPAVLVAPELAGRWQRRGR